MNECVKTKDEFDTIYHNFLLEFGLARKMVLSSSTNYNVSSRMMSIVQMDGLFYFQTDQSLRKYNQLISNPHVPLCIDNIQIEGICEEIGHPTNHSSFCNIYKECYKNSFERYSSLEGERLFMVKPTYIERWIYMDNAPYIEIINIEKQKYDLYMYVSD